MTKQKGYILFITFSMLALCTALVSVFMVKGITHKRLSSALLEQEQLNQFAMSTLAIGQSFLSFSAEELKAPVENDDDRASAESSGGQGKEKSEKGKPLDINKALLEKLLPVLGKSQEFKFEEIEKDFPLVINLIFFAESGKININGLYDLVLKKFYDEGVEGKDRKVFATWLFEKIAKITEKPSLLQPFVEHMKQRKAPLNDVTELLAIKEFADCFNDAVFYGQKSKSQESANKDKKSKKLFLTDIFTVACENDTIQPWLLSSSVCALLDIAQKNDKKDKNDILDKKEEKIDLSSFKQQSDWQKDWDTACKPLYGISYDKIPESVRGILAPSFQATVFSVLASVFNENMTVQVFAILKQKRLPDGAVVYDVIKTYQV